MSQFQNELRLILCLPCEDLFLLQQWLVPFLYSACSASLFNVQVFCVTHGVGAVTMRDANVTNRKKKTH